MPKKPPSELELAVIVAAFEAVQPRAVVVDPRAAKDQSPSWRFSGRSWGPRPAANRPRPTF
jgi:hypothetical protein